MSNQSNLLKNLVSRVQYLPINLAHNQNILYHQQKIVVSSCYLDYLISLLQIKLYEWIYK
jgi:hypothetical protein